MKWSFSEFLNHVELRGQAWCIVEMGARGGISVPPDDAVFFHAALEGTARIAGATGEPIRLAPGDVALILSGEAHALRARPDGRAEILEFLRDGAYVDIPPTIRVAPGEPVAARILSGRLKILWPGGMMPNAVPAVLTLPADMAMLPPDALREATTGTGAAAVLTRIASLLLTLGLRRHPECRDQFSLAATADPIARALQLIDRHAQRSWTVASLAQKVGMGRSNFAARFTAAVGRTPMEILAERRMHHAADLLRQGALKVAEIAARVGYRSEAAFIRRFTGQFGITPGRMRANQHGRGDPKPDAMPAAEIDAAD